MVCIDSGVAVRVHGVVVAEVVDGAAVAVAAVAFAEPVVLAASSLSSSQC